MNQFFIVGVVNSMPELKQTSNNVSYAHIQLSVTKSFKNSEEEYEEDLITCTLWRGIADSCIDICKEGSLIGIRGRIQSNVYTNPENKTYINYEMVAEKVSFFNTLM